MVEILSLLSIISVFPSENETLVLVLFNDGKYVRNAVDSSAETDVTANVIDFGNDGNTLTVERLTDMATEAVVYAKGIT